ncbi:hypothetical protein HJC23_007666 [Cyclotella cryptica]|uniref:Vesicle transport protein n=1 Tax=Cyclotella cryptica TaxID=29204 RepID=A0ABD3PRM8_9STRA|eukprot:CCRYP_012219-RA/>CCRYP_012219-RA protein AED:0.04 eAED:0.04 QI:333/1/1/1/1/1/2/78/325
MLLFGVITSFAALWSIPAWGDQPRHLLVKSAFIRQTSKQILTKNTINLRKQQSEQEINTHQRACSVLEIRGGAFSAYDNYDEGDGYDANGSHDDGMKDYENEYRNRYNQYDQPGSYGSQDRYGNSYYSRRSENGYYDDEGRYHEDYDDRRERGARRKVSTNQSKLPEALTSGNRKLGLLFLSSGAAFTALGITLFFNKTLMRLGNLLFVCGVPLMIGPGRTLGYFLQPKKARATGCLVCGIFLVLVGHPVIGILLEIFGLLNLFGNMFPVLLMMAKNLPIVGGLLGGDSSPSRSRRERRREDDEYNSNRYEDDMRYNERYPREQY